MFRITHHRENCIGCGYCVEVAPYRWIMNKEDGKSNLISAKNKKGIYNIMVADDEYSDNKEAEELCPVKIIKINRTN